MATRKGMPKPSSKKDLLEEVEEEVVRPWTASIRPSCADEPIDNSFTLEDELITSSVDAFLAFITISDPCERTNPLVFASPSSESVTGYAPAEAMGKTWAFMQGAEPDVDQAEVLQEVTSHRHSVSVETTNYKKDGRAFQNLICHIPVVDHTDTVRNIVSIQHDLDDRRKRDTLDDSFKVSWVEQVKQHITAFMVTDCKSDSAAICTVNTAFTALTGYSRDDLLGHGCLSLCGPDSNSKAMKKLITNQATSHPAGVKLLCYKKDGNPFWAYIYNCPLQAGKGQATKYNLCIVVDITLARLKRVGKYVLGKVIGSGAFGLVRKGKNTQTDEIVAVKAVDASRFRSISEIEQIQEEMSVSASLKHPNIIRLYDVHFLNNIFYLVMEFASGGSLVQYIQQQDPIRHCLDEENAHRLFLQMVSALDFCHRRRVIHRDLKPENILMDEHGNIKICDFGLAAVSNFSGSLTLQCGTPEFTAPEITLGKEYDGPSVDIWSMGVILYEAVCGQLPFKGANQQALSKAIQRGVYEPMPSHLSSECRDVVRRMLTVDHAVRVTMDELLRHAWCRDTLPGAALAGTQQSGYGYAGINQLRSSDLQNLDVRSSHKESLTSASSHSNGNGGSSESIHDSVRLVYPSMGADRDDPITAAILRGQLGADHTDPPHLNLRTDSIDSMDTRSLSHGGGLSARSATSSGRDIDREKHIGERDRHMPGRLKSRSMGGALANINTKPRLPPLSSPTGSPTYASGDRRPTYEVARDMISRFRSPAKGDRAARSPGGTMRATEQPRQLPPLSPTKPFKKASLPT